MRKLVVIAVTCLAWAVHASQPPTPSTGINTQSAQQQTTSSQQAATQEDRGTDNRPLVVKVVSAKETDAKAAQSDKHSDEEAADEHGLKVWTVVLAAFTGLIFATAAIQAGLFFVQLRLMKQGIEDATATAKAAEKSAIATEETVRTMRETAQRQLRAYVFVDSCSLVAANADGQIYTPPQTISAASRPVLILHYKNTGQTPAYQVVADGTMCLVSWPLNLSDLPPVTFKKGATKDSMGPGAIRRKYEIPDSSIPMLTDADIAAIKGGTKAIFAYGEIRYNDIFGHPYFTRYRYFVGGVTGLRAGMELSGRDDGNEAT